MIRQVFDIVAEPVGEPFRSLVRSMAELSSEAFLVVRDGLGLSPNAQALLARLRPHVLGEEQRSSWPGTSLLGEEATVIRFLAHPAALEEIVQAANGLFDWQQPDLPEDLGFLRADGSVVLASIAHEQDAFLELSEEEHHRLAAMVGTLDHCIRPHEDSR